MSLQPMQVSGVDYVICAAGAGQRFKIGNGVQMPAKPLLTLKGRTLLEHSLDSLDFQKDDRIFIIVQKAHAIREALEVTLRRSYPCSEIIWLELEHLTKGQLETALVPRGHFSPGRAIAIFNADTSFYSKTLRSRLDDLTVEGIVPCSREPGDAWSFCAVLPDSDLVTAVAEKKRISEWASVGYYFFRDSTLFLHYADQELKEDLALKKEYYVAPLYSRYLNDGRKIVIDRIESFRPMGTPEQLACYWNVSFEEFKRENGIG